MVELITGSC